MGQSHHHNNLVTADYNKQLSRQLQTELPDRLVLGVGMKVLIKDEGVGDSHIEKKVVNVLIKLPTLGAAAVVASQLITVIHCTHPPVV